MLENSGPEFASVRHVRQGIIGAGGELPGGWTAEQLSSVEILDLDQGERGPGLTLRLKFAAEIEGEYVSLSVGQFRSGRLEDMFVFSAHVKINEAENIEAGFAIIREWQVNGPFVSQATREFPLAKTEAHALTCFQVKHNQRALQPVITFKRAKRESGQCVIGLRRVALASLYDYPGWLKT